VKETDGKTNNRECPGCGYLMAFLEVFMLRGPIDCPRCGSYTSSEFKPVIEKEIKD